MSTPTVRAVSPPRPVVAFVRTEPPTEIAPLRCLSSTPSPTSSFDSGRGTGSVGRGFVMPAPAIVDQTGPCRHDPNSDVITDCLQTEAIVAASDSLSAARCRMYRAGWNSSSPPHSAVSSSLYGKMATQCLELLNRQGHLTPFAWYFETPVFCEKMSGFIPNQIPGQQSRDPILCLAAFSALLSQWLVDREITAMATR